MTTRHQSWRRKLSQSLLRLSAALLPPDQSAWAMAMRAEVAHIGDDRDALSWAAGSVGASLSERLRALRMSELWSLRSLVLLWITLLIIGSAFNAGIMLVTRLHYQQVASALGTLIEGFHYQRFVPLAEAMPIVLIALMVVVVVLFSISLYLYLLRHPGAFASFCIAVGLYFGVWVYELAIPALMQSIPPERQWRIGICFVLTLGLLAAVRSSRWQLNRERI